MHPVRLFLIVLALALTAPATQAAPFAYVPNVTGGSISVIDSATDTVTSTIPIPAIALTVNSTGSRVYAINAVAGPDSVRVHVIDTATNSVIATMPFGGFNQATSIALSSDDRRLYVGEFIGPPAPARISLAVFDTITNTRVANVDLGSVQPVFATVRSVAAEPAGTRVYAGISSDGTNIISEIERRCDEVAGRVDLGPGSFNPLSNVLINSAGTRLYALDSQQLRVIEPAEQSSHRCRSASRAARGR
jgi:YVTN family beta-propeller protein